MPHKYKKFVICSSKDLGKTTWASVFLAVIDRTYNVRVHRQNVLDALNWLTSTNPQYSDIRINYNSLNSLPIDGIPLDLLAVD